MCRLSGNSLITEPQPNSYIKIGRSRFLLIVELCHKALLNTGIFKKTKGEDAKAHLKHERIELSSRWCKQRAKPIS